MTDYDLKNEIDRLTHNLAEQYLITIQMLSAIAGLLERNYNGSHSRFVSQKSTEVAEILGLNDTEVFEIKTAGLLHDIGKVGMKDSVKSKFTSEMNHSEISQYNLHPILGMNILLKCKGLENVAVIIEQHHERYDGSGFPNGLMRTNINIGARIISVVDYFHNAVYRKSRMRATGKDIPQKYSSTISYLDASHDKFESALKFLSQKSGFYFDSKVVDVFTSVIVDERKYISKRAVMRVPVNRLLPGMIIAEDYYTNYGLLIIAKGEALKQDTIRNLNQFSEIGEISKKILVFG